VGKPDSGRTARTAPATHQRIWQTVREIPPGHVATYGQIAELAGLPRRARLVGYALHSLPEDIPVPWHRVITARGELAFPRDSRLYRIQRRRLLAEAVLVTGHRIDLKKYRWNPSLDELLWKPRGEEPF
jgi:methylated-DNA-protein-cysteine methyltransferase-like protein